jgi:hypothetical protein
MEDSMAEQRDDRVGHNREETTQPENPPNSVLSRGARRAAVWSYFAPVVVLFAVIGVALVYWSNQPRRADVTTAPSEIGTTGRTDGGFNPAPRPDDPRDEVNFRSGDLAPVTSVGALGSVNARTMAGRRVEIDSVKIDSVSGNIAWIHDGDQKIGIITPAGAPALQAGATVAITGRVQADAQGGVQVIADRVDPK